MFKNKIFSNSIFLRILFGHSLSSFATGFSLVIIMAKYYEISRDANGWAFLVAVKAIPFALLGLFVGCLIDRFNKRWIIAIGESGRAILYFWFIFAGNLT